MFDGILNAVAVISTIAISLLPSLVGISILGLVVYLAFVGD